MTLILLSFLLSPPPPSPFPPLFFLLFFLSLPPAPSATSATPNHLPLHPSFLGAAALPFFLSVPPPSFSPSSSASLLFVLTSRNEMNDISLFFSPMLATYYCRLLFHLIYSFTCGLCYQIRLRTDRSRKAATNETDRRMYFYLIYLLKLCTVFLSFSSLSVGSAIPNRTS